MIRYGLPPGRGLDLGCGDGHLMSIILSHLSPRDLAGMDIDPRETSLAARRNIYREIVTAAGDRMPSRMATSNLSFRIQCSNTSKTSRRHWRK